MRGLTERQLRVMRTRWAEGASAGAIGEEIGKTRNAVMSQVNRARQRGEDWAVRRGDSHGGGRPRIEAEIARMTDAQMLEALRLDAAEWPHSAIATRVGVRPRLVSAALAAIARDLAASEARDG